MRVEGLERGSGDRSRECGDRAGGGIRSVIRTTSRLPRGVEGGVLVESQTKLYEITCANTRLACPAEVEEEERLVSPSTRKAM